MLFSLLALCFWIGTTPAQSTTHSITIIFEKEHRKQLYAPCRVQLSASHFAGELNLKPRLVDMVIRKTPHPLE